ncbi:MAG: peptidoglycan recognition family protein, partial [bacterium]
LLFFLFFLLLPSGFVSAEATLKIGDKCQNNDQCLSEDCEESSKKDASGNNEWYCDCDELGISNSEDCFNRYDAPAHGGEWRCINGFDATYKLDYCVATNKEDIFFAIPPTDVASPLSKAINFLLNPTAASKIEVTNITEDISDKLAIKIPGLDFTKLESAVDEQGYLYIPWLGQYIAAMYKFGVAMASIIAVIMIIVQGVRIILSGGGEGKTAGYKRIGQILLGLMILWGSYAIMYTINPALVSFTALRVKYIATESLSIPFGDTGLGAGAETGKDVDCAGTTPAEPKSIYATGDNKYFGAWDCIISEKSKRALNKIDTVVIHEGARSPDQTIGAWIGTTRKLGYQILAQYIIDREGKIYQVAGEEYITNHAEAANVRAIGIDLATPAGCSSNPASPTFKTCSNYTNEQYDALKTLIQQITQRTSVRFDDTHVIGHCQVKGASHADPRRFIWEKIGLNTTAHFTSADYPNTGACIKTFPSAE